MEVTRDVPMPATARLDQRARYPFPAMGVGDSFAVEVTETVSKTRRTIRGALRMLRFRQVVPDTYQVAIAADPTKADRLRVWRTA